MTLGGTVLSVDGQFLVVGGATVTAAATAAPSNTAVVTIGGNIVTVKTQGANIVLGSQTLKPGQAITISGVPVSLNGQEPYSEEARSRK